MIEALIAGERDPRQLAMLARGRMKAKNSELITALDGRFDDHHAELARMLLGQIDALSTQIDTLTARIEELIAELPDAGGVIDHRSPGTGPGAGIDADPDSRDCDPDAGVDPTPVHPAAVADDAPSVIERLDEIPGIGPRAAQAIIAELGLDMSRFPTPEHLVSWAKLCPRTIQSGPISRSGKTGKGNPYLKGALGEAATAAAKTNTFLGERYRRIVKRRGKLKALVAVARSILRIVWQLLADPTARFHDLGPDYHTNRAVTERKVRNHIAQLAAMGFHVTLAPAA
jgi:transposase